MYVIFKCIFVLRTKDYQSYHLREVFDSDIFEVNFMVGIDEVRIAEGTCIAVEELLRCDFFCSEIFGTIETGGRESGTCSDIDRCNE